MEQCIDREELSAVLMGEMLLFGLLGKALYSQPDRAWLQSLIDEDVFSEIPFGSDQADIANGQKLLTRWCERNRSGLSEQVFLDIQADNARLFIGTGRVPAPVWESVYFSESRMVFQEETLQVRKWYRRFNLEPEKLNSEPDDHIGLEMAFVSHLAKLGLQELEQGGNGLEELLAAQREFMSSHLLRWAPTWCAQVAQHAKTDLYRGLAWLTIGALRATADWLEIEVPAVLVK